MSNVQHSAQRIKLTPYWVAAGWVKIDPADDSVIFREQPPSRWMSDGEWTLLKYLFFDRADFYNMCKAAGYSPSKVLALLALDSNGVPYEDS